MRILLPDLRATASKLNLLKAMVSPRLTTPKTVVNNSTYLRLCSCLDIRATFGIAREQSVGGCDQPAPIEPVISIKNLLIIIAMIAVITMIYLLIKNMNGIKSVITMPLAMPRLTESYHPMWRKGVSIGIN